MTRIKTGQSQRFHALVAHLCGMSLPIIAALVLAPIPADADDLDPGIAVLKTICASARTAGNLPSKAANPILDELDSQVMAAVNAAAGAVTEAKRRVFDLGVREKLLMAKRGELNEKINFILRDAEKEKARIRSKMDEIQGRNRTLNAEIKTLTDQLDAKRQELKEEQAKPWLGRSNKRIGELQGEIAGLEKDLAGKMGEKRDPADEFSRQQQELSRVDADWFAKVGPLQMQLPQVNTDLEIVIPGLKAARKSQETASLNQTLVEQGAGQARICIQQVRNQAGGQQRGEAINPLTDPGMGGGTPKPGAAEAGEGFGGGIPTPGTSGVRTDVKQPGLETGPKEPAGAGTAGQTPPQGWVKCRSEKTGTDYYIPYGPCPPPSWDPPVDTPTWQGQVEQLPPKVKKETTGAPVPSEIPMEPDHSKKKKKPM